MDQVPLQEHLEQQIESLERLIASELKALNRRMEAIEGLLKPPPLATGLMSTIGWIIAGVSVAVAIAALLITHG